MTERKDTVYELGSEDALSSHKDLHGSADGTEETYAESVDGGVKFKKSIDRELECPICIKLLFRPVSTACGHTFCQLCLEEALEHRPHCPLCREPISSPTSCHENRLVQSLIAKQYPVETRLREQEIENAMVTNDIFARSRRRDLAAAFLKKHKKPPHLEIVADVVNNEAALNHSRDGDRERTDASHTFEEPTLAEEPIWAPENIPVIFQNYKYELPFPSDYVELYFEAPMYLDLVADVLANSYPGFVIVLDKYNARRKRRGHPSSNESGSNTLGISREDGDPISSDTAATADSPSSDDMELYCSEVAGEEKTVGVMIEIQQCLTFNNQMQVRPDAEHTDLNGQIASQTEDHAPQSHSAPQSSQPIRARSTLQTLFTSVRSPPAHQRQPRIASWVPRRLYQHRLKFKGNRRDMWHQIPQSNLFPEGCCIIRGECLFRTTINKAELQYTPQGYAIAPVAPLFDVPLHYGPGSSPGLSSHKLAESLTRSLSAKINSQLAGVCPAGKVLFQRKFGSTPPLLPRPNSVYLEYWSLWASKVLQIPAKRKAYFMSLNDTVDRLRKINNLLDGTRKQHMLALGLSSAGTESFSWMLSSGPCASFVLGLIIFVFLVAASFWHRFGWDGRSGEWPFYSV